MKLDKIILELKEILKDDDLLRLSNLISKLEQDFKESKFINNVSDKTKINTIKKILDSAGKTRPILGCFSKQDDYTCITDSYEAYYLKDNVLPFNYAKSDNIPNEDNYIKENNLKVVEGKYPNLLNFININEDYTILEYKVDDILKLEKVTPFDENKKKVCKFNGNLYIDLVYLKNCIKILQLKDTINIEFYGEYRPILIRNDKQEIGLILPIRTY